VRAGLLRYRWTIQQKTVIPSASGEPVATWTDRCTVWGDEKPQTASEVLRNNVAIAQKTTILSIRWRAGLTPAMRATREGRILDIEQVLNPDGRKREIQLLCTEVVR
jgi:SPP1 family predicted phage head-tail adaptor